MSGIVRQSKFRHVFGKAFKKELQYDDLRLSTNAWDSNYVSSNSKYFAMCWAAGGGGSVVVVPWEKTGKLERGFPLIAGHKNDVLDCHFNLFNDSILATVSGDATTKIWAIPDGGLTETMREPVQTLKGHRRQVGTVRWHPTANNVLVTSSKDYSVKVWDVSAGDCKYSIAGHSNFIQSTEWNTNGSLLVSACKDKKARIIDPRQSTVATTIEAHTGVKGMRSMFLGDSGKVLTVGFSRSSDRQFMIWDPSNPAKPLFKQNIDTSSGLLMPFYDVDTKMLFLGGKGDANIRYYELSEDCSKAFFVSAFQSKTPQRGMDMLPKIACNVSDVEIVRLLKVTKNSVIPISFKVPRRGSEDIFQDDLFPETYAGEAVLEADAWFGGANGEPKKVSLENGFAAKERSQSDFKVSDVKKEDEGPSTESELREEYKRLKDRVVYLEAEIVKKDAIISELKGK